jgi:phage portal protein BeeE
MALVDRVSRELAKTTQSRDGSLSLDDYASFFAYGGITYPLLQTTMGSVDEERIMGSAVGAMKGSGPIFALIQARVQAFSQIRFQWTRFKGSQPGDLFGTDDLRVLEHPWPNGRTENLLARMEVDNCLAGNGYVCRPRKDRLARLRPDFTTIVLGSQLDHDYPADAPDVEIAGFMYWPRSGQARLFFPNEVAHYAPMPDPDFQFLGMSWLTPIIREIQADTLTTEHKYRFFENAATPNLAIKFDPSVTIELVKQFKDLLENEHQGAFNAYKTLYLGGGADPVAIGKDFQQLEFAVTQGHGESRLAAAAGVPASWVGFSEGMQGSALNASTFNQTRRRFSDGTMYHLWATAAAALEAVVPPSQGQTLWFDNRIPFMREDAADQASIQSLEATIIATLVREGFTAESIVRAVANNDWSALVHTGMLSVQLQPPGSAPLPPPPATVSGSNGTKGSITGTDKGATVNGQGP